MQWLGNNGIGHHPTRLGFVSITTCQAIVYVTDQHLFGLHNYDWGSRYVTDVGGTLTEKTADDWLNLKIATFVQFVQNAQVNHQSYARTLYAVINASSRYTSTKDSVGSWKSDVGMFAKGLKFKGKVLAFRVPADVGNGGGVNVLFDRKNTRNHDLEIFYQKYDPSKWSNTGANRNPTSGSQRGVKVSSTSNKRFSTEFKDDDDLIGYTMQDAAHADMTKVALDGHEWKKSKSLFSF